MSVNKIKVALIHDWIPVIGGAERVLEALYKIYPGPIHTLICNREVLDGSILQNATIHTSFIQKLPFASTKYRNYLPLFPLAVEQFDLSAYDIVISSSYAVAKGVITNPNQIHICYCHSPVRYAWDLYHQYMREAGFKRGIKSVIAKLILHYIRIWDVNSTNRVDYFIANSGYIARRIQKIYRREAIVIHPPVDVESFTLYTDKEDFFLTASRFVPYKKIDLIVDSFNKMKDKKLVVIGEGPDFEKVKSKAGSNIVMLGYQPFQVLKQHMQKAKAFVFAAEEDFGITPVEAQACGTPVICFGKGGTTETIIDGVTGVYFKEQTSESLIKAVEHFESIYHSFNPVDIRKNAERFSPEVFTSKIKAYIQNIYDKGQNS